MRKLFLIGISGLFVSHLYAASIPAQITYQGTLKQSGVPANGPISMEFKIINQDDTITYWNSQPMTVTATQGLFSQILNPQNALNPQNPLDWENTTPYIQVIINPSSTPVTLAPSEPITTTMFSLVAGTVIDGSITPVKINMSAFQAAGPGLVPAGAIMMFDTACPAGWIRYSVLDGNFPLASSSSGQTGGSSTHQHLLPIFQEGPTGPGFGIARPQDSPWGGQAYPGSMVTNTFPTGATLNNLVVSQSSPASSMPPYMTMIFCKKN